MKCEGRGTVSTVRASKSLHRVKKKILVQQDFFLVRYVILNVITSLYAGGFSTVDSVAMATMERKRGEGVKDREDKGEMTHTEDMKGMVEV